MHFHQPARWRSCLSCRPLAPPPARRAHSQPRAQARPTLN
ncbi:hypothetical protein LG3211_1473 [Lysobacter gummosus]|nr:hypothetical protein LG3211_1473 [Lysobacter gummosus]